MATLKEIQNCELEILKAVAKVCDDNKINYYLAAGTFLGAVRHKGFIPWDDDIDIYIKNSDLKKLKRKCKKELPKKHFWQDHRTDRGTPYMMTKIRNENTYMLGSRSDEEFEKKKQTHQGIWIDIMPIFRAAKNEKLFRKQIKCALSCQ